MNKKLFIGVASAIIAVGAWSNVLRADVYFSEGFDYADGSLTTVSSDWTRHSGTEGQIQVSGGKITLTDSQSEDVNRLIGTTVTTGTVFAGFDFSVSASNPGGTDFEYFAHFRKWLIDFTARMDSQHCRCQWVLSWNQSHKHSSGQLGFDFGLRHRLQGNHWLRPRLRLANLWIDASARIGYIDCHDDSTKQR